MATPKTDIIFRQFNETIEKWIIYLDDYSFEMLCRKPQAGSWSLGQVYRHIADDTKYFVEQMRDALSGNADSEKEKHEDAKFMLEKNEFPDTLMEGPATDSSVRQPQSKDELLQDLVFIKEEVGSLYAAFDFELAEGKTRHPGLLYFNALEWLQFAEMHMRHHLRQKKRIDDKFRLI